MTHKHVLNRAQKSYYEVMILLCRVGKKLYTCRRDVPFIDVNVCIHVRKHLSRNASEMMSYIE